MTNWYKRERLQSTLTWLWLETRSVLGFLLLMIIFRSAVADWSDVPTGSMKPTIVEGDRIFVNKLAYDLRIPLTHKSLFNLSDPQRGDIIIFDSKVSELRLVKRVIGVPGDIVEVRQDIVTINGHRLVYAPAQLQSAAPASGASVDMLESFDGSLDKSAEAQVHLVRLSPGGSLSNFGPVRVPEDSYFALGDNRDNSADSRIIGFIPREEIVGKSSSVVFSLDYENYYLPRVERFFHSL